MTALPQPHPPPGPTIGGGVTPPPQFVADTTANEIVFPVRVEPESVESTRRVYVPETNGVVGVRDHTPPDAIVVVPMSAPEVVLRARSAPD